MFTWKQHVAIYLFSILVLALNSGMFLARGLRPESSTRDLIMACFCFVVAVVVGLVA